MIRRLLIFSLILVCVSTLVSGQNSPTTYTLFFIGDCGEPDIARSRIGEYLATEINNAATPATVLYLGDNVYPRGLPPRTAHGRNTAETILRTQAGWLKSLNASGIFVPGNHDWQRGGRNGYNFILDQGAFIDSLGMQNVRFLPTGGCPGPVEIPLSPAAVLVIIDTQWLLHPWEKPGLESACDAKTTVETFAMLEDVFERNRSKRIVVAAHHPPITYGEHGGTNSLKDHLFPLTQLSKELYIPLPVIGSIYPLYRKLIGDVQDTAHPLYREFSNAMQTLMAKYPGSVFAAGHEHSLEYIVKNNSSFIVSGSGSKTTYVRKKKYAKFADDVNGFVKLSLHEDGSADVVFFQAGPDGYKIVFKDSLSVQERFTKSLEPKSPDFSTKNVRIKASELYEAGPLQRKLLGANYRDEWATEIDVPVFNISEEQGGLKVLQKGGGMQTLSLRMEDKNGREFVLRSVEKYPENAVPEMLRKTFAQDLVQDQISASHPYAAIAIPRLAEAAGIYHTNPKIVFIPDDPNLGEYQKDFANRLALFEERPAGDWSDKAFFGNSDKIVNTSKVIERLRKDNDNQVDQAFVLRSRLFDLWIGDWDRHDDQWRWATFERKKKETYRPIPRDRDQAFFLNEGKLAKMWSKRWALPKFEGFDEDINWPSGLSFNARYFDRSFLSGLSEDVWIEEARELERNMTDSVIEKSIRDWPVEIAAKHGDRIIHVLKARRAGLLESSIEHYRFLAREVDVVGSDKNELFDVERKKNGDVSVVMYKIDKEGSKNDVLYKRLFKKGETHEIRLFGLGGDDGFEVVGDESPIRIRVIGGEGNDKINDTSGSPLRTLFYDQQGQGTIVPNSSIRNRMSNDADVNLYDRKAFRYDKLAPLLYGNFNPDDGLFIGGGFVAITQGFRKDPFKNRHVFLATVAPLTWSYNFRYQGKYTKAIGKWDIETDFNLKAPNYVNNFFGLGNETRFDKDAEDKHDVDESIHYYRFRFEELLAEVAFSHRVGPSGTFKIGPVYQRIEIEEPGREDRFIDLEYAPQVGYNLYEKVNSYGGVSTQFIIDKRNDKAFTARGVTVNFAARTMAGLNTNTTSFSSMEGSLALFQSFRLPARVVFALRVGGGRNFGKYAFYQAQILDGRTELRGFRKTRFYGDSKLFTNIEMRVKVASFRTYMFPASFGFLMFQDGGRVWYNDGLGDPSAPTGKSSAWHMGWGGGVWFTPFNFTVLSLEAGHSKEGTLGYVRFGFLF